MEDLNRISLATAPCSVPYTNLLSGVFLHGALRLLTVPHGPEVGAKVDRTIACPRSL